MRAFITCCLLTLPLTLLSAATVDGFLDLRVGAGTTLGRAEVEVDNNDGEWDTPVTLRATAIVSGGLNPGGLVYGATLAYQTKDGEIDDVDIDYNSTDLRAHLGYGLALIPEFHLEALATIGAAYAEVESVDEDDTNIDFQYGGEINAIYTMSNSFQIGGGLGFILSNGEYDLGENVDLEQDELIATFFVGLRL